MKKPLRWPYSNPDQPPSYPCPACGCVHYARTGQHWRCQRCHPWRLGDPPIIDFVGVKPEPENMP